MKAHFLDNKIKTIGQELKSILSTQCNKRGFHNTEIITEWHNIVGENIAKFSNPIKIYKGNNKTTLLIQSNNSSFISEFQFLKNEIITKINSYFGKNFIQEIKLQQFFN